MNPCLVIRCAVEATPAGQTLSRIEANLEALYDKRMCLRTKGRIERCWMRLERKYERSAS